MKTAHIVTGGKGNVGKTAFAELLTCAAIAAGQNPVLIDGDSKKQTFSRLRGKSVKTVVLSDDPMFESQPDLIWHQLAKEKQNVIVDLAAQSDHLFSSWLRVRGIADIANYSGAQIIKWWIADLDSDSFDELADLCEEFPTIKHVLVQSHFRARPEMWAETLATNKSIKGAIASGLEVIEFPRMFVGVMDSLRRKKITFTDVLLDEEHKKVDMLNRSTVINWVAGAVAEVGTVYEFENIDASAEKVKPADTKKVKK